MVVLRGGGGSGGGRGALEGFGRGRGGAESGLGGDGSFLLPSTCRRPELHAK